eukprot:2718942-Prymnesium_polylepis.1
MSASLPASQPVPCSVAVWCRARDRLAHTRAGERERADAPHGWVHLCIVRQPKHHLGCTVRARLHVARMRVAPKATRAKIDHLRGAWSSRAQCEGLHYGASTEEEC